LKFLETLVLSIVGIGVFLLIWIAVVELTRPAKRVQTALGIAMLPDGSARILVVDDSRKVVKRETIPLAKDKRDSAVETLRVIMGEDQPKRAAVPPGTEKGDLRDVIEMAKAEWGGGLVVVPWKVEPKNSPEEEAEARARALQESKASDETWLALPNEAFAALLEMSRPPKWKFLGEAFSALPDLGGFVDGFSNFIFSCEMLGHTLASLYRVFMGFLCAAILGIPLGLALGSFARLNSFANGVIQILRPISPIAWLPAATLLFGGGNKAAIFLILLASSFPVIISTAAAVGTIDLKYRRSAMNFGIRGLDLARSVLLPATLPQVLTALRVAVGIAWLVVVAAEMLGVEAGLGYLVLDARNGLHWDRVEAAMIMIGVIGLLIDLGMRRLERRMLERRGFAAR
jgi:NitT/TauT family transport system permease protein